MKTNRFLCLGIAYSGFLFCFLILFSIKLANVSLILFYAFSLFAYFANKQVINRNAVKLIKFSTVLLLVSIVVSLISGTELELVLNGLGRRITFILTPLAFLLLNSQNLNIVKNYALKGLVLGTVFSCGFLLINIAHEYYLTRDLFSLNTDLFNYYHTNFYFTRVLDIHPSYYGMFVITALSAVYFYKGFSNKTFCFLFFVLCTIVILFLNVRIILFLYFVLNIVFLINYFYARTKNLLKTLLITGVTFFALGIVLFYSTKNTYTYQRVFNETLWELSNEVNTNYNAKGNGDSRMARWLVAYSLIEKKPLLGYGVFNETNNLSEAYYRLGMQSSYKSRYNAHNQFLGFMIEGGLLSGIALIVFFIVNFFKAVIYKDILYFLFVFSMLSICLIENYLLRNAGVIFVSFFGSLYLFNYYQNES